MQVVLNKCRNITLSWPRQNHIIDSSEGLPYFNPRFPVISKTAGAAARERVAEPELEPRWESMVKLRLECGHWPAQLEGGRLICEKLRLWIRYGWLQVFSISMLSFMFESRFYLYLLRFANLVLPCWWGFGAASKILATLPCSCTSCPLQQTSCNGGSLSSVCCEKLRVGFKQLIRGNTTPFQLLLNAKHTKRRVYVASLRLKLDLRIIWKFTKTKT